MKRTSKQTHKVDDQGSDILNLVVKMTFRICVSAEILFQT